MAGLGRIRWWQWLPWPQRRWRVVTGVDAGDEVPERLPPRGVVLVGDVARPTWIAFDCPCGRGHRLMVNLDPARRPRWRIESLRPLSIRPSIDDITSDRRCHFFIRSGKIAWAHNEPRSTS
jgi:hypothetical protein